MPIAHAADFHVLHTPGGPVTQVTAANWQGSGIVKSWIATEEDAARVAVRWD